MTAVKRLATCVTEDDLVMMFLQEEAPRGLQRSRPSLRPLRREAFKL
jgi:hypothetical protein